MGVTIDIPGRWPEDATFTQRRGSHAGATTTGILTAFFLRVFMCPVFKASARGSPWPAADTALRQEIGAAACCLRLPLYAAAFSPRPTCKFCFLKTFLWKIWIGCEVFETFVNELFRALTVAQGRRSRSHQKKRPATLCTGCGRAAPTRTLPVISQLFLPTACNHLVQRHECIHLHIYHARILAGAQQRLEPLFFSAAAWGPQRVLAHIGAAVAHMHGLAWVHRDIKPANIAVLDWSAKASASGKYLYADLLHLIPSLFGLTSKRFFPKPGKTPPKKTYVCFQMPS